MLNTKFIFFVFTSLLTLGSANLSTSKNECASNKVVSNIRKTNQNNKTQKYTGEEVFSYLDLFEYYYDIYLEKNTDFEPVSYDMFVDLYYEHQYSIDEFIIFLCSNDYPFINPLSASSNSSSTDANYILDSDIGEPNKTNKKYFKRKPVYSNYDYSVIQTGDIVFEAMASFDLKHVAFVYNNSKDSDYGNYIQTVEAVAGGVQYGFVDDTRVLDYGVTIYRIYRAGELGATKVAKEFISQQLGKPYEPNPLEFKYTRTDINSPSWYCSELIFAAYYYAGLDIVSTYNYNFDPKTMPCLPVDLTRGINTISISIAMDNFLQLHLYDFTDKFWWNSSFWTIEVFNPNNFDITVEYNTKMCFEEHARDWEGLGDIKSFKLAARQSNTVDIYQNWSATSITFSWVNDTNVRYITAANNLSKTEYTFSVVYNKI